MEKIKVMIADDSDFVRDGMRIILSVDPEFEVIGCASNGREVIELAKKTAPDIFLMDIQMPIMDGYEATKCIRNLENKALADIPILAMTANAFEEDRKAVLDGGMNGHIDKPVDVGKLLNALKTVLRY